MVSGFTLHASVSATELGIKGVTVHCLNKVVKVGEQGTEAESDLLFPSLPKGSTPFRGRDPRERS